MTGKVASGFMTSTRKLTILASARIAANAIPPPNKNNIPQGNRFRSSQINRGLFSVEGKIKSRIEPDRSEERRVGKECRSRWSPERGKKRKRNEWAGRR